MMTPTDIRMCVADAMQDDEIENIDSILRMLNNDCESSWRAVRGQEFSAQEVVAAIRELLTAGMITPCAEAPSSGDCTPVRIEQVGTEFAIESLWFHLEQSGRDAVREWWDSAGQAKFPLESAE
jgi:hypothetical protein